MLVKYLPKSQYNKGNIINQLERIKKQEFQTNMKLRKPTAALKTQIRGMITTSSQVDRRSEVETKTIKQPSKPNIIAFFASFTSNTPIQSVIHFYCLLSIS